MVSLIMSLRLAFWKFCFYIFTLLCTFSFFEYPSANAFANIQKSLVEDSITVQAPAKTQEPYLSWSEMSHKFDTRQPIFDAVRKSPVQLLLVIIVLMIMTKLLIGALIQRLNSRQIVEEYFIDFLDSDELAKDKSLPQTNTKELTVIASSAEEAIAKELSYKQLVKALMHDFSGSLQDLELKAFVGKIEDADGVPLGDDGLKVAKWDDASKSVGHMKSMLGSLKEAYRTIERPSKEKRSASAMDAVRRSIDNVSNQQTKDKNIKFEIVYYSDDTDSKNDVKIECEENILSYQILSNILTNAIKYSNPGSTVSVAITDEPTKDEVRIHVLDTGTGMSRARLELIYGKGIEEEKKSIKGSLGEQGQGIGTSVAASFAKRMGAKISAWSTEAVPEAKIEGGTIVTICLKRAQQAANMSESYMTA